jgi:pyruvate dehydrogenase E2 component (dihydrolipoamide acetyltransferase)
VANEIVIKEYIHIGIAVDTEAGLIVPVLRDVDKKSDSGYREGTGSTGAKGSRSQVVG